MPSAGGRLCGRLDEVSFLGMDTSFVVDPRALVGRGGNRDMVVGRSDSLSGIVVASAWWPRFLLLGRTSHSIYLGAFCGLRVGIRCGIEFSNIKSGTIFV